MLRSILYLWASECDSCTFAQIIVGSALIIYKVSLFLFLIQRHMREDSQSVDLDSVSGYSTDSDAKEARAREKVSDSMGLTPHTENSNHFDFI